MILTYILSPTVFQLSRSIGQIIAFDKGVPVVNALVLDNLKIRWKGRFLGLSKKSTFPRNKLDSIFVAHGMGLTATSLN